MSHAWIVLAAGASVYALRLAGLLLPRAALPPRGDGALDLVPIAVLSALVVATLGGSADGLGTRLAALVGGALVAFRTGRMWACIASGMLIHWLLTAG